MRRVLRIVLWPLRGPVRLLRRLVLTPTEARRGPDHAVEVDAFWAAVRRESAAGRGDRPPGPANPVFLDTAYPAADDAFRAAAANAAPGTAPPAMDHFRPAFAAAARFANRVVFKLSQPLMRVQREFNRAALFLLRRLDADLGRLDVARHRQQRRLDELERRVAELEARLAARDKAA